MNAPTRRGMTLLEVVISIVMLASLGSIILGSITFMERAARREHRRLEATEVAHRLITQALVNQDQLPDESLPIEHGVNLYYFKLIPHVIVIEDEGGDGPTATRTIRGDSADLSQQIRNQLHQVVVHVYPADQHGNYLTTEPTVTLSRVYNIMKGDEDVVFKRIVGIINQEQQRGRSTGREER